MLQRDDIRILDMEECIKRIQLFTYNMSYDDFVDDIKTQDAVIRNLEIIGEAAKSMTDSFKQKNGQIAWHDIGRLRDKLIHHYSGVNTDIIWAIIQKDIPTLKKQLEAI